MNPNLRPGRRRGPYHHGILSTEPSCHLCPLRYKKKVLPDGPVPARLAFIGMEPGYVEEKKGRGFVGPSGELLWTQLAKAADITREECWVTNSMLCRAERVRLVNGAIIEKKEVQQVAAACCYQRLIDELCAVDPVVCIPLGDVALKQLTQIQKAKIYAYRGSRLEVDLPALSENLRKAAYVEQ